MQLLLLIISSEKTEDLEHVQTYIGRWESKILALSRDFDKQLSEKMNAATSIAMVVPDERRLHVAQIER